MWNKHQNQICQKQSKLYFQKCAFLCACIFEPQINNLLYNKLDYYKVLIDYKNLQADFSDSGVECVELQSRT